MSDATPGAGFSRADLTTFARLDELGLEVVGQRLEPGRAVLACRVVEPDDWCRRCGCQGRVRDTVRRRLAAVSRLHPRLTLSVANGRVRVVREGGGVPVEGPVGGARFSWTREDGKVFQVVCVHGRRDH